MFSWTRAPPNGNINRDYGTCEIRATLLGGSTLQKRTVKRFPPKNKLPISVNKRVLHWNIARVFSRHLREPLSPRFRPWEEYRRGTSRSRFPIVFYKRGGNNVNKSELSWSSHLIFSLSNFPRLSARLSNPWLIESLSIVVWNNGTSACHRENVVKVVPALFGQSHEAGIAKCYHNNISNFKVRVSVSAPNIIFSPFPL